MPKDDPPRNLNPAPLMAYLFGQTWAQAEFLDPAQRHAWRRWKFAWLTPKKPGQYTLLARAKDANGNVQPDEHDQNYGTYVINHPLPIEVFVKD